MCVRSLILFCTGLSLFSATPRAGVPVQGTIPEKKSITVKSREFFFTYGATITQLKPKQDACIWIPIPKNTPHQRVKVGFAQLPGKVEKTIEKVHGNRMFYIRANANGRGPIPLQVTYRIKRFEVRADNKGKGDPGAADVLYLKPNTKVPISGKPLSLIKTLALPKDELKLGKTLFDVVNGHMTYSKKGIGWGQGDAAWACDSKFGNCTDFHSLFISLARANKLPAKFEIGFGLPATRGKGSINGYHCWALFKPDKRGWIPVDISQASMAMKNNDAKLANYLFGNITEDRVSFTTGRDLSLSPKQSAGPLNFFIYPHVEVGGKEYPQKNIRCEFSFMDIVNQIK